MIAQSAGDDPPGSATGPDGADAPAEAGGVPAGLLAARKALVAAVAERDRLAAELREQQDGIKHGIPEAVIAEREIRSQIEDAEKRLTVARQRADKAEAAHVSAAARAARQSEEERRRDVARFAREYEAGAAQIADGFKQLGALIRAQIVLGIKLHASIGNDEARRLFGEASILSRLGDSAAPSFILREGTTHRALPWPCNPASPYAKQTFTEVEMQALAAVVRIFDRIESAQAMRARLDPLGVEWHVVEVPTEGLWHLVHAPLRGKAREAALAKRQAAQDSGAAA